MTDYGLILNPKTKSALRAYLNQPTHALLLTGENGVGLNTIATTLAREIAGANTVYISPRQSGTQKTTNINVEEIKALRQIVRGKQNKALAIIVDEAEKMTHRAPETFLKILEEPNNNIFFILTTHQPDKLPATILSRVQKIIVLPAPMGDCRALIDSEKVPTKRRQIEFLAAGKPAEITRLISDDEYFRNQARQFEAAKQFTSANTYERLKQISAIKTRDEAIKFVDALARLSIIINEKQPNGNNLSLISDVLDNLHQNGNLRAQLTYLSTNLT